MTKRPLGIDPRVLNWADVVVFLSLVGLLPTVGWLGRALWAPFTLEARPAVSLTPWHLPYYAARSLLRMFAALGASLVFTLVVTTWAARSARAARLILPALDILQSVPVLGFLSATVTFFMALVPGHVLGLELAAIFAIFTSQVWNLTFAFYQVLITRPREQSEALRTIPLVWNGMLSFGGSWFFLAASEAITVLNQELLLPGVGSFMALAAKAADVPALAWAVLTMVIMILVVDAVFWRPLVAWAAKFKIEESAAAVLATSPLLELLRRSHLVPWFEARLARVDESIDRLSQKLFGSSNVAGSRPSRRPRPFSGWAC